MRKQINKVMENLKNKSLKVVRVDKTEFELDNGWCYVPFGITKHRTINLLQT